MDRKVIVSFTVLMAFGAAASDGINSQASRVRRESSLFFTLPKSSASPSLLFFFVFLLFIFAAFFGPLLSLIPIVIQVKLAKTEQLCPPSDSIYQCSGFPHLISAGIGVESVRCGSG